MLDHVSITVSDMSDVPAGILIEHNCLYALNLYYYARLGGSAAFPIVNYRETWGKATLQRCATSSS
jgi:hypothetical protein